MAPIYRRSRIHLSLTWAALFAILLLGASCYSPPAPSARPPRRRRNPVGDLWLLIGRPDYRIAFISNFGSYLDWNTGIYAMNADGSNQTRLTTYPLGDAEPIW